MNNSLKPITGTAWCFGDNINTDLIYPGRFLTITEPTEMAKFAMVGVDPEFINKIQKGDIIIAGHNFGCGSSREQAALCLKHTGISSIIALSFARIFYRNIINLGVLALTCQEANAIISSGDNVNIDFQKGELKNISNDKTCKFEPLPEFIIDIIMDGGIIPHLKKKINKND